MEHRALGKGLSALISDTPQGKNKEQVTFLKTSDVRYNSLQPRVDYSEEKLSDLKASIKAKGVLQPILVRRKNEQFEVVAGERRLRAAQALKLEEVPVIIKDVSDQEALVIALIENIQREELNPIEEANAFKRLIEQFKYTQETIAQSVGKDRSTIGNFLRLLNLSEEMKKSLATGKITVGHARALLSVENEAIREELFEQTVKKGLSVRELENLTKKEQPETNRKLKKKEGGNPQIKTVEEGLQKLLGTKVRIQASKKRGRIVIDYYSFDDLNRIVKIMIHKP